MPANLAKKPIPYVKRPSFICSLAALAALTATAVDIALPAQPLMATSFGGRAVEGGIIVSAYFLGFGPGQLIWGPLADKYGRMLPMMYGLLGFLVATIFCIYATSLEMLAFGRMVQGIFGGSTPVIARTIARDQGGGKDTANLLATIMMIFGAAPLLAPLVGSAILLFTDWRGTFWFLVIFSVILMGLTLRYVAPATAAQQAHSSSRRPLSFALVGSLFKERDFIMGASAMAALFTGYAVVLAAGAAMAEAQYGLPTTQFGPLFATGATAVIIGPAITKRILKTSNLRVALKVGALCCGLAGCFFLLMATTYVPLYVYWACVFLYVLGYGMIAPVANTLALENVGSVAGTASSVLSAIPTTGGVLGAWLATSSVFSTAYEALSYMLAAGGITACVIVLTLGKSPKK
ncbi:MAG: MFS transporter [Kordiimonadaceae bacterium]|nr:MFS transporter [Kordiimonadaceae bacterium]